MDVAQRRSRPAKKSTKRTAGARPRGGARKTPARRGAGRPVVHWEINARDPKALHGFYSELFGWKINADNPMGYGLVTAGGDGINGGIGPAQGMPGVTFYVSVPDLDALLRRVGEMGGSTVVPPTHIPNMVTFAVFTDPEGNRIGIIKR